MRGVNKITLMGFVLDVVDFYDGEKKYANFVVGTPEDWLDTNRQRQERIEWHKIVLTGRLAEVARDSLKKGQWVYLEGRNKTRAWNNQQGQKQYTTEVWCDVFQMLPFDNKSNQTSSQQPQQPQQQNHHPQQGKPNNAGGQLHNQNSSHPQRPQGGWGDRG